MFKSEDIAIIFSNIEQIYDIHKRFYREMQKRIDHKEMYKSQIGQLFVRHVSVFHDSTILGDQIFIVKVVVARKEVKKK